MGPGSTDCKGTRRVRFVLRSIALALFGLLTAAPACALDARYPFHDFVVDNWGVEQGLPQISVLGIAQDRAGYLWLTTQTGVARFDGERFANFDTASTGADLSMSTAIWADPADGVWFGNAHGAVHESAGRFTAVPGPAVFAILDNGDGTPLLATARGLAQVRDGRIAPLPGYDGPAYSLLRDGRSLWIGGAGRVCKQIAAALACVEVTAAGGGHPDVEHLALEADALWLGTHSGLFALRNGHVAANGIDTALDSTGIETLYADRDGELWIGTTTTLYRRHPDGTVEQIAAPDLASDAWIEALYEDRDGNLWLGSRSQGLYRAWRGWVRRIAARDGMLDPFVWSIVRAPDGNIVFGTNSDVETFDGQRVSERLPGSALPNPSVYELFFDSSGRLWIGTRAGLALYDHGRDVTPSAFRALDADQISDIHQVGMDDFWIGTSGGLYRWRRGALQRIDVPSTDVAAARVRSILPLGPDHVLIGTEDGVREWHAGKWSEPAWAAPLRGHFVSRVAMLRLGMLGVATLDDGIGTVVDRRLRMLHQADGLPTDNAWVFDVLGGDLYVGSIAGVWRLPLAQLPAGDAPAHRVRPQILVSQGFNGSMQHLRCCNGGARSRSLIADGAIWYATISGAVRVDATAIDGTPQKLAAVIEGVQHNDQQLPPGRVTIRDSTRDVAIQYSAPFFGMGTIRYRYRLQGYDNAWLEAGDRHIAYYTHLPPGSYTFEVAAALNSSAQFGPQAQLPIVIRPFWYETLLARMLSALLIALAALGLFRLAQRTQRRRSAMLEGQVAQRTEQLARVNERLRVANLALAAESHSDVLTGLHNRRHLQTRLPELLQHGERIGVLLIDLDEFKQINDRHGHATGDRVLHTVGSVLAAARRESDLTIRWGGEEFLLLLRDVDALAALATAERLRVELAAQRFDDTIGGKFGLSCSIGFSLHPLCTQSDAAAFEAALELADLALYRAKQDGRNACVGLIASAKFPPQSLHTPLAAQLDALLASGALRWLRPLR